MPTERQVPRIRSALFVPGQRRDFLLKADSSGADAVILDLEDSVATPGKPSARTHAGDWLRDRAPAQAPLVTVRVNAVGEGAIERDLDAVVHPALLAVLVPKVRTVDEILEVAELLSWFEGKRGLTRGAVKIWPIIETAEAVRDVDRIAGASSRIAYLGGGTSEQGDLARAIGFEWSVDGWETLYIRSRVLVAARAAGVPNPITGLVSGLADPDEVRRFALSSRQLGYAGMMVIHPKHVAAVNMIFTPSADQLREATRVIAVIDEAADRGIGAVNHDGRMIDVAMARTAATLIADAAAIDGTAAEPPGHPTPRQKRDEDDSRQGHGGIGHDSDE
jgi:citrate lyase subunit beta/citryl-CoA lyase